MTTQPTDSLDTLLDYLASDEAFRERMLGDPVGALGSIGITLDPAQVPAVRSLPSKESIAADRDAIKQKLGGTVGMLPFFLSGKL
ncbi:NHLP-related RiPP peptide [Pseudoduganella namucuonensis]|uniref:Putative modified peptide n=1 Tax=Pseudoduganella namucuonensis TaxID=1035707 RepID=A0A1I7K6F5_9BURK|nr:NHLP-related RiPP peptide [Pseudoduganella namucuonensis]SFU93015.1 putative modified peptide [Pseudoduganella namucuonensis]